MEKKLSFIVPVYNVEAYLPQCLDSILKQATADCETILVDDGATDGSGAICDRYCRMYPNVRVIHKENGGLSSARNAGTEAASGRYICYVDSDDYIGDTAVSNLLAWIDGNDADICFLQAVKVYPDGRTEPMGDGLVRRAIRGKSRQQVLEFLSACPKYPGSAWAKLFRRDFLERNQLRFPDDRRLSEDLMYSLNAFLAAERFDMLEFPFYYYRQKREGSISNSINARLYFDNFRFVTEAAQRFSVEKTAADATARCVLAFAAYEFAILTWRWSYLSGEDAQKAYSYLREYRWVLKYGRSTRVKLVNILVSLVGLRLASRLLDARMGSR